MLARARERRTRDLGSVRCVKDENVNVLIEDTTVQKRCKSISISSLMGNRFDGSQHSK